MIKAFKKFSYYFPDISYENMPTLSEILKNTKICCLNTKSYGVTRSDGNIVLYTENIKQKNEDI